MSDRGYGCDWSLSYAAADVVNACRALRGGAQLPPSARPRVFLYGESFGGRGWE